MFTSVYRITIVILISIHGISSHTCDCDLKITPSTESNATTSNATKPTSNVARSGSSTSSPTISITSTSTSTIKPNVRIIPSKSDGNEKVLICYYGTWAVYRPGRGKYPVENIDPFLCTHLIYSFSGLGYDNKIRPLDPWNDLPDNYGKGAFVRFVNLKKINPQLKTLLAIGGWNEGSIKYSTMSKDPSARKIFVQSVLDLLEKYSFDGLDVDWEYPASRGGRPEDRENFISLLSDLKEAFTPKGLLLTSAVSAGRDTIDSSYDVAEVSQYLDYINVMTYDYHGGWERLTGHNAPLFPRPDETGSNALLNVNFSINYWISRGASPSKIVMGMATYGRSFTLAKEENNGLYADAPQKGQAGPYTREAGSLGYNEICEMQMKTQWTVVRDPYYMAPYSYSGRQWVGYDDVESITLKTRYINKMGLAGGMIWSLETDDFLGLCHNNTKYPLLNAIKNELNSKNSDVPQPPLTEKGVVTQPPIPSVVRGSSSSSTTTSTTTTTTMRPSTSRSTPRITIPSTARTKPTVPRTTSKRRNPPTTPRMTPSTTSTTTTTTTTTTMAPSPKSSVSPLPPSSPEPSTTMRTSTSSSSTTSQPSSTTSTTTTPSTTVKLADVPSSSEPTTIVPSTSTTTTTVAPSTVPEKRKLECITGGMFRNPNDCKKFYRCVDMGGRFRMFEYDCPQDTVFDSTTQVCQWPSAVPECTDYYGPNTILGGSTVWKPIIKRK
ncbi:chitotriosidase-1-like [Brevipalpus obovatus]|uniref:chitotriosidase-1-like n=1 Tax=Brevipalpus obovatus TaxID=246614 RepID=UPI003D9F8FDA